MTSNIAFARDRRQAALALPSAASPLRRPLSLNVRRFCIIWVVTMEAACA